MTAISSESLYSILGQTLDVSPDTLQSDTYIRSLPNADSMRLLQVILQIEKMYGIEVPDTATFSVETVGEFEQLVRDLHAQQSTSTNPEEHIAMTINS